MYVYVHTRRLEVGCTIEFMTWRNRIENRKEHRVIMTGVSFKLLMQQRPGPLGVE